jgi:hypothetical protein
MLDISLFVISALVFFIYLLMTPLVSTIVRFIIANNHLEFIVQHIIFFSIMLVLLTIESILNV